VKVGKGRLSTTIAMLAMLAMFKPRRAYTARIPLIYLKVAKVVKMAKTVGLNMFMGIFLLATFASLTAQKSSARRRATRYRGAPTPIATALPLSAIPRVRRTA
jgi:hypothetical protein